LSAPFAVADAQATAGPPRTRRGTSKTTSVAPTLHATLPVAAWTGFCGQCEPRDDVTRPLVLDALVELLADNRALVVVFMSPLAVR